MMPLMRELIERLTGKNKHMEKLPEDFKAKWVAALRSGECEQGKHRLFDDGKYCCIGVLGCILGVPQENMSGYSGRYISKKIPGLPPILSTENGNVPSAVFKLTGMNDGGFGEKKHTFPAIADYIEQNL